MRRLALVAAIGPVVFVLAFLIEGAIRPGYTPASEYVSALSLGPRGWVQITSFIVTGLGVMLLALLTSRALGSRRAARVASIMLGVIGLGLFLSGPFVMDPTGTPFDGSTPHGLVHGILGGIVFLLMPIVPWLMLGSLRPQRWAWMLTLVLAVATTVADLVFVAVTKVPQLLVATEPVAGIIQRSVLVPFMAWCVALAISLARGARETVA